jgi:hypothetical protein
MITDLTKHASCCDFAHVELHPARDGDVDLVVDPGGAGRLWRGGRGRMTIDAVVLIRALIEHAGIDEAELGRALDEV